MNWTIVEMARSMLHYMNVDRQWWGEAVVTATYIVNRIPNTARPDMSPLEVLTGTRPSLEHLKVFGSPGFIKIDDSKRSKWDSKAHRCIFLGYSDTTKGFRVWDIDGQRIVTTRTIQLDERPPPSHSNVMLIRDGGGDYVPLMEDDDESRAQPLPTQRSNVEDMEVDTPSAAESEEMEVDDSMANADADTRSLVPITGRSEDRSRHPIDTHARVPTVTLHASTHTIYPMVSSTNGSSQALVRPHASSRHLSVVLEDRLVFSSERTRPHRLEFDQARLLTDGSEHAVAFPNDSPADQPDTEADALPESKRQRVDSYEIALSTLR